MSPPHIHVHANLRVFVRFFVSNISVKCGIFFMRNVKQVKNIIGQLNAILSLKILTFT